MIRMIGAAHEGHQGWQEASFHPQGDIRIDEPGVQGEEHAGRRAGKAADHDGDALVLHGIEPDRVSGALVLLDAAERQAQGTPGQVEVEGHRDDCHAERQIVGDERAHEERRGHVETVGSARQRPEVQGQDLEQKDQDQCPDGEVQALESEERECHHGREERGGGERGHGDDHVRESAQLLNARDIQQHRGHVRPESEKGALAQIDVAEKAVQHVVIRRQDQPHEAQEHHQEPGRREKERERPQRRDGACRSGGRASARRSQ